MELVSCLSLWPGGAWGQWPICRPESPEKKALCVGVGGLRGAVYIANALGSWEGSLGGPAGEEEGHRRDLGQKKEDPIDPQVYSLHSPPTSQYECPSVSTESFLPSGVQPAAPSSA